MVILIMALKCRYNILDEPSIPFKIMREILNVPIGYLYYVEYTLPLTQIYSTLGVENAP